MQSSDVSNATGAAPAVPDTDPDARGWRRDDLAGEQSALFYTLSDAARAEIANALDFARANGLTVDTVEQQDFRIPSFARDVPDLRQRLDTGRGFFVLRGIGADGWSEADAEIISWAICNYLGLPIRQGIGQDRRFFTVADKGVANTDPTRVGASSKRSAKHSDNGCLEARPPCYLALYCYRSAAEGGDSTIIPARGVYDTIQAERPDLLPLYFDSYHFRAPQAHVWPSRGPTVQKPILEVVNGELHIHYARIMIEPGMEMAGTPLTDRQREALDFLDEVLDRPELNFRYTLAPGECLVMNNLIALHGREAFGEGSGGRTLKRFWMWRRHIGPGLDPVKLDLEEMA
ncbi:TauD/TfdA family dioxygenase [Puniceibacterium sp. IMCC21224]|uniref:TauD/TfdA family dioxygenase n=1 Tax=Puniceibacterium sp. IMCC21224 TaxID=1618204 RepID=UPI00064D7A99|nr:TauD/TfdA family dioxygenase [Puniceibacterium sp. IMCC21224]KMK64904.1 Taurine catabolism dioxygenase TauD, TfdA family [Puniceibacterium sp. IMCC21224]